MPRGFVASQNLQTAAVATGNGTPIDCRGFSWLAIHVVGITSATITWETSLDGTNWFGVLVAPPVTGTGALTTTADGVFRVQCAGFGFFRARISTWVSGTINVIASAMVAN
jgi:hypothetical protein